MTPGVETPAQDAIRRKRYHQAARLLEKWAAEDADYDQRASQALERELLNDSAMRCEDNDAPAA
jgi:hypothetical protein